MVTAVDALDVGALKPQLSVPIDSRLHSAFTFA